jgi:hypothetical protein
MAAGGSHLQPGVILVGDQRDRLVGAALQAAREYELEVIFCPDVYCAAAELARGSGRCLMVIGTSGELVREEGRLFALARAGGAHCCCLLDEAASGEREQVLAAVRGGAQLVGQEQELRDALDAWLAAGGCHRRRGDVDFPDDYRATEAELSALLGQENDEQP